MVNFPGWGRRQMSSKKKQKLPRGYKKWNVLWSSCRDHESTPGTHSLSGLGRTTPWPWSRIWLETGPDGGCVQNSDFHPESHENSMLWVMFYFKCSVFTSRLSPTPLLPPLPLKASAISDYLHTQVLPSCSSASPKAFSLALKAPPCLHFSPQEGERKISGLAGITCPGILLVRD